MFGDSIANCFGISILSAVQPVLKTIFQQNVVEFAEVQVQCQTSVGAAFQTTQINSGLFGDALPTGQRATTIINAVALPRVTVRLRAKCLAASLAEVPYIGPFQLNAEFLKFVSNLIRRIVDSDEGTVLVFGDSVPIPEGNDS